MPRRALAAVAVVAGLAVLAPLVVAVRPCAEARAGDSPLDDADRRAFAWFDGVGVPSCAGKQYVRVTWVRKNARDDAPPAERLWEIDGFLVAEDAAKWTILDADQLARKVDRAPKEWTTSIATLDLAATADAVEGRLRAIVQDPGSVEPVEQLFRGVRSLLGDEGQALGFARHCAENRLDAQAHAILVAARALPAAAAGEASTGAPPTLEARAGAQMAEPFMRRLHSDLNDLEIPRSKLLERFRGWRKSFPGSPHVARADGAIRAIEPLVKEDAQHRAVPAAELAKLAPAARAKELVWRLRDQTGDVWIGRDGTTRLDLPGQGDPADQVAALGFDAVPALLDAVSDERWSRVMLFRLDEKLDRQTAARVGDVAQHALERITGQSFRQATPEAPSMFQDGSAAETQKAWRAWWEGAGLLPARLAAMAAERDTAKRTALARAFPDRGTGRLAGAADAVWGTKSFAAAVPKLAPEEQKAVLRVLAAEAPMPRTRANAAWALLDLGDDAGVAAIVALWPSLDDTQRADPEQGGAVVSFLAACGRAEAVAALADHLDERPPAVRELAVLAFDGRGLGAVRGFAADRPDGVDVKWPSAGAALDAAEDLLAARLNDLEQDPLGRIPRQTPICDMVPEYDCGRRIAHLAIRVLAKRWPARYEFPNAPVHKDSVWEERRLAFLETWKIAAAGRAK
jgi:hypothetical protein